MDGFFAGDLFASGGKMTRYTIFDEIIEMLNETVESDAMTLEYRYVIKDRLIVVEGIRRLRHLVEKEEESQAKKEAESKPVKQEWCEHIKWQKRCGDSNNGHWYLITYTILDSPMWIPDDWVICPYENCGAKRPQPEKKKELWEVLKSSLTLSGRICYLNTFQKYVSHEDFEEAEFKKLAQAAKDFYEKEHKP